MIAPRVASVASAADLSSEQIALLTEVEPASWNPDAWRLHDGFLVDMEPAETGMVPASPITHEAALLADVASLAWIAAAGTAGAKQAVGSLPPDELGAMLGAVHPAASAGETASNFRYFLVDFSDSVS